MHPVGRPTGEDDSEPLGGLWCASNGHDLKGFAPEAPHVIHQAPRIRLHALEEAFQLT